jgi:hypothetical protein
MPMSALGRNRKYRYRLKIDSAGKTLTDADYRFEKMFYGKNKRGEGPR